MVKKTETQDVRDVKTDWLWYVLLGLIGEKIVQHAFVTLAFYFDWAGIGSTVAVSPTALMVLGAMALVLFVVALVGMWQRRRWATVLVIGLAVFDLIGEFVAQGTLGILLNVSFIVATVLLCLALIYRRNEMKRAAG